MTEKKKVPETEYVIEYWLEESERPLRLHFKLWVENVTGELDKYPEVEGSLKWDGCMDWRTHDAIWGHFCAPSGPGRLATALKAVWELGPLMEAWDG